MHKKPNKISVIIPVCNEQDNIIVLYDALLNILKEMNYELIFVDDGSTDDTLSAIKKLSEDNQHVRFISFTRNFGHQNALKAGYDYANGDCVISLDGDMQHPPDMLTEMISLWEKGYEVVATKRKDVASNIFKKLTSHFFYFVMNLFSEIKIEPGAADFRLLDRKVVNELKKLNEKFLFYRGLIPWLGYRQIQLEYTVGKRFAGKTKYSFSKMIHFASAGITSFSVKPLKLSIYFGFVIALLAFFYILYAIYISLFTSQAITGWASTIISVLFIGGIQLIMIGIVGNYIGKIFMENKNRPNYIIKERNDSEKD